jgi:hypothetical protein
MTLHRGQGLRRGQVNLRSYRLRALIMRRLESLHQKRSYVVLLAI